MVARPDTETHSCSSVWESGSMGRGGHAYRPLAVNRCISSSPRAQPAQNGAVSGSSTAGSRKPGSPASLTLTSGPEQECAGGDVVGAGDEARVSVGDLVGGGPTQLAHALEDVVEAVDVGLAEAPARGVRGEPSVRPFERAVLREGRAF